jgi:hypothetical protein
MCHFASEDGACTVLGMMEKSIDPASDLAGI